MFEKLGQMANLMRNLPRLQEEMQKFQQGLGQITAEGDAGAGAVKVRVNGRLEVVSCQLSEGTLKSPDRELLEDLIRAATNQALQKVRGLVMEKYSSMFASMGLPPLGPGMGIPGMF